MLKDPLRRVGDFLVPEGDRRSAEAEFSELPTRRRALDKAIREPIPSEKSTWADAKHRYDYPGVDTPTERPRESMADTAILGDGIGDGEIGVLPDGDGGFIEDIDAMNAQQDALFDAGLGREP